VPRSSRGRIVERIAGRRWSAEDARAVLAELDGSGLSVEEFAGGAGLDAKRLYRWRRRLRDAGHSLFVEVTARAPSAQGRTDGFEVELDNGRRVRVPVGFDAGELRRLVEALEGPRVC
jgi:transposase-like protein